MKFLSIIRAYNVGFILFPLMLYASQMIPEKSHLPLSFCIASHSMAPHQEDNFARYKIVCTAWLNTFAPSEQLPVVIFQHQRHVVGPYCIIEEVMRAVERRKKKRENLTKIYLRESLTKAHFTDGECEILELSINSDLFRRNKLLHVYNQPLIDTIKKILGIKETT